MSSWRLWYLIFIVCSCDCLAGSNPWHKRENGPFRSNIEESSYRLRGAWKKSTMVENWHGRELEIVDSGPGSKPPRCETKCGKCTPCTPVRVPVQPGPHKTSEYYPEAWRCKCKGRTLQASSSFNEKLGLKLVAPLYNFHGKLAPKMAQAHTRGVLLEYNTRPIDVPSLGNLRK